MILPHRIPFLLPLLYPSLLWRIRTKQREVYLTFDDGPVYGPTEFVLDQLKAFSAKATFFCIGDNVRKHPEVFKRIINDGHAVGNHTFNHLSGWRTPNNVYRENVHKFDVEYSKHVGDGNELVRCPLFRPPYGRISRSQISTMSQYKIVMWDVLSFDFEKRLAPEKCFVNTLRAVRPGSIVVFHDSIKAERNMTYALPRLLEALKSGGYELKTIPLP
jgi:peptidoglycan-N-acetylglucosamine deacetylase